jgi:hypothetical protein
VGTDDDRRSLHEFTLDWLEQGLRADLWSRIGLTGPLRVEGLWPWVLERWTSQEPVGERLTLRMPRPARGSVPQDAEVLLSMWKPAQGPADWRHPYYHSGTHWWVDAFAGRYLEDDLTGWPTPLRWPSMVVSGELPPLGLVALAAHDVCGLVNVSPEQATLFLLCDVAMPAVKIRANMSAAGGTHIWVPNAFATAKEVSDAYVSVRRAAVPRRRAAAPTNHTAELIAYIIRERPHRGRNPANTPWATLFEMWNANHERGFTDAKSMQTAYIQAIKRRKALGLGGPPSRDGGETT